MRALRIPRTAALAALCLLGILTSAHADAIVRAWLDGTIPADPTYPYWNVQCQEPGETYPHNCVGGDHLPFGVDITITGTVVGGYAVPQTVYMGGAGGIPVCSFPPCRIEFSFVGRWGNVEGDVKLVDGTHVSSGPWVKAYLYTGHSDGMNHYQLINKTPVDSAGHYRFPDEFSGFGIYPDASTGHPEKHWVFGVVDVIQLVLASDEDDEPSLERIDASDTALIFPSTLNWQDLVIRLPTIEHGLNSAQRRPGTSEVVPEGGSGGFAPSGPTCPTIIGRPIDAVTGGVYFDQVDATVAGVREGVEFIRAYNSSLAHAGIGGSLGRGWTHSYEKKVVRLNNKLLRLQDGKGVVTYFSDPDGDGTYQAILPWKERGWITTSAGAYTRHFQQGGREEYRADGALLQQVDRVGNVTSLELGESGEIQAIVAPGGRRLTLASAGGLLHSLSGPDGLLATYTYDGGSRLQRVEYADQSGYVFEYDTDGQILSVKDLEGKVLETHAYSGGRGASSGLDPERQEHTVSYGTKTVVKDALGNSTQYEFLGTNLRKLTGPCSSCGSGGDSEEWTYTSKGYVTTDKNGLGEQTRYEYGEGDVVSAVIDPLSRTTRFTRDEFGRVLTTTAPDNSITTWTYGLAGPLTVTDAINRTTQIEYNAQGLPIVITDARGKTTHMSYNAFGDVTSITDALNKTRSFTYDGTGRVKTATDELNHTTSFDYDGRGHVTKITSADGTHVDFTYDKGGRRLSATDALGRLTRYGYDGFGRLLAVLDPLNGTTRYEYDVMSRLRAIVDAKADRTTFDYDAHGRVSRVDRPGGASQSLSYDAAGRLVGSTDERGIRTNTAYDALGRITGKTYSDSTPAVSYSYGVDGRLLICA